MGKLIVHVGNASAVFMSNIVVLGSLLSTPREMSLIGRGLRPSNSQIPYQVFTNNDHVINGLRLAVKAGDIKPEDLEIHFHPPGQLIRKHELIKLDADGNYNICPAGFMDQATQDLIQLF